MMTKQRQTRQKASRVCALFLAAVFAFGSLAHADEKEKPWLDPDIAELSVTEMLTSTPGNHMVDDDWAEALQMSEAEPGIVTFAKDCAEIDAIPLLELAQNTDKRVFIGINFDGVLGIHGML